MTITPPGPRPRLLVLTPVKDAAPFLDRYFALLDRLDYPKRRISLGFLESDSTDDTHAALAARLPALRRRYRRAQLWKHDQGLRLPEDAHRWARWFQEPRRAALARSRNQLLMRALDDEDWVLWVDVDLIEYPADIMQRLLATGLDIVHPHCVLVPGGATYDHNGWRDHGRSRMDAMRGSGGPVRLDAVGGTMLLVRADLHRDGLIFPSFAYGNASATARRENPSLGGRPGEIETEGFGIMARDMGHQCWGLPDLEIIHRNG